MAWAGGANVKPEIFVCAQSDYKNRRHDRNDYNQSTMEHPRTFDPTECKHAIRHHIGSDNPQPQAFYSSSSSTIIDDIQKQRLLELKQPPFCITKLDPFHYGAFARNTNSQTVKTSTLKKKQSVGTGLYTLLKKIVGL